MGQFTYSIEDEVCDNVNLQIENDGNEIFLRFPILDIDTIGVERLEEFCENILTNTQDSLEISEELEISEDHY